MDLNLAHHLLQGGISSNVSETHPNIEDKYLLCVGTFYEVISILIIIPSTVSTKNRG